MLLLQRCSCQSRQSECKEEEERLTFRVSFKFINCFANVNDPLAKLGRPRPRKKEVCKKGPEKPPEWRALKKSSQFVATTPKWGHKY